MPSSYLSDPEHGLQQAMQMRWLADQANDTAAREDMLRVACQYDLLAERARISWSAVRSPTQAR
jgi:hypothetical protein